MLTELCQYLKNWFLYSQDDVYTGDFIIQDGTLPPSFLGGGISSSQENDGDFANDGNILAEKLTKYPYIRIIGSRFNDGVHKLSEEGATDLVDEEFFGTIWVLSIPPVIEAIAAEIAAWRANNAEAIGSPYQSESFGGYSYSKGDTAWQSQFASRLAVWRKL